MAVSIRIDSDETRRPWNNEKLERLKAIRYPDLDQKVENLEHALYEATKKGNVDNFINALQQRSEAKKLNLDTILKELGPSANSLLHVAASYGRQEITELLVHHFPSLITKKNVEGNTPLHVAAGAGEFQTTKALVDCAKDFPEVGSLLRIKNKKENTSLHEAVMMVNLKEVQFLVMEDPQVTYTTNKEGKSPLYLAVELETDRQADLANNQGKSCCCKQSAPGDVAVKEDSKEIVTTLLEAINYGKLEGKNPMHPAVEHKNLEMLKVIVDKKRELMNYKDETGRTPLHWAAFIGYVGGVHYLLRESRHAALEKDKDGFYPIHLACENGHVEAVEEFLKIWPDPSQLLSDNCQNILHVASGNGKEDVVKFLIKRKWPERDIVKQLKKKKDLDGNTPMHLATIRGQCFAVWSLAGCKEGDSWKLKNSKGLTAYDIALTQTQTDDLEDSKDPAVYLAQHSRRTMINDCSVCSLAQDEKIVYGQNLKAKENSKQPDIYHKMMTLSVLHMLRLCTGGCKSLHKNLKIETKHPSRSELKEKVNTLMVVATLVAGATFAAAVQTPQRGGESCEREQENTNKLFQWFIFSDSLAMSCSIAAVIILWVYFGEANLGTVPVRVASWMLWVSISFMVIAFLFAAVLASKKFTILSNIVTYEIIILVLFHVIVSVPLFVPAKFRLIFLLYIYFLNFSIQCGWRTICAKFGHLKRRKPTPQ